MSEHLLFCFAKLLLCLALLCFLALLIALLYSFAFGFAV
jgi:hypothetical protein